MKTKLILVFLVASLSMAAAGVYAEPRNPEKSNALDVVALRIAAYNSHDIDSFLAAHAEQVQIYEYPDKKIGEGRAHLRRIFEPQFAEGLGSVDVKGQFVIGNNVVSHEIVTVEGRIENLVIIYTVENGEITSFRLLESDE